MQVGVDEAGKGPVLGSMFVAAVRADPAALPGDVGDSKDIAPDYREALAETIRAVAAAVNIVEVPVDRIDAADSDMNSLTVEAHTEALQAVAVPDDDCFLDAGDTSERRFARRVTDALQQPLDPVAKHGADATYSIVGAASILAKSAREAHVTDLAETYGTVGSGYPSDPRTREFLTAYVEREGSLPPCARESWQTSQDAIARAEQTGFEDF